MKSLYKFGISLLVVSCSAVADPYYGGGYYQQQPPYDQVDATINQEINQVNAQEQQRVMRELQEGDYRGAERAIQQGEAMKQKLRREEASYDAMRNQQMYQQPSYGWDYR